MASDPEPHTELDLDPPPTGRRLHRAERREQIVIAATRAFARSGFAATSLEDVAGAAGVSRVILYRHFDSKADLYRAVLDRVCTRLLAACGDHSFTSDAIPALVEVAAEDPDGFRLMFQHAAREPEFQTEVSELRAGMTAIAHAELAARVTDPSWARWAAQLCPTVAIEGIIAWLDVEQPDPGEAAERIGQAVEAVIRAAQTGGPVPKTRRTR
ncbi:MAG: TetR/AcrR family transcriptional regulator [Acidimicrobiia bacterium]